MALTKGTTDEELFYDTPKLDTHNFDGYNGFLTSPAVGYFGPNYVYAAAHKLISSTSALNSIVLAVCKVAALVRYCINGLSTLNRLVDIKKLRKLFILKPEKL